MSLNERRKLKMAEMGKFDGIVGDEMYCYGWSGYLQGRWPRQETLTLLDIRLRLHPKFNQLPPASPRAPLWDEVSRIMAEEHGYQRSGKKCKQKLDNLYKYYKKTKGSGNDGKHYRFFNQLQALYGGVDDEEEAATHSLGSMSNSFKHLDDFIEDDSSDDEEEEEEAEGKMKELMEMQMRRLMEVQESWMNRVMREIERSDEERVSREEEWRKREAARSEQEERSWACERDWIQARDAALFDAMDRISCKWVNEERKDDACWMETEESSERDGDEGIAKIVKASRSLR